MRALSFFYLCIILVTASFFSLTSSAHSDDINQATLSFEDAEHFQLVVEVDFIHLLKKHLAVTDSDKQVIELINQLSFFEQKKLLENVQNILSEETNVQFEFLNNIPATDQNITKSPQKKSNKQSAEEIITNQQEMSIQQQSVDFSGLTLQQLKQILAQKISMTNNTVQLHASGNIFQGTNSLAVRFSPLLGDIVLKVIRPQQEIITSATLSNRYLVSNASAELTKNPMVMPSKISNALDYVYQGFVHIIPRGLDHILFVLALLLFAKSRAVLLWQISAFTLAHTITLALGIYGVLEVSSTIVEPLIAL